MRTKYWFGTLLMALVIGTMFTSCEKDDGSEGILMRMRNADNGGNTITLLYIDSAIADDVLFRSYDPSYVYFKMDGSNNFYLTDDRTPSRSIFAIASVGKVGSLGRINSIPETGWAKSIAVQPGHGYIIRSKNNDENICAKRFCKYARVYVEEWIEGTSGGILGAVIRYQDNWKE